MDRRRLAIISLVVVAAVLAALPALASARYAYVTGSDQFSGGSAARLDLDTQTVEGEVSFGGEGSVPDVAITPDGKTAYVINGGADSIVPFDVATKTQGTAIEVGFAPVQIAITPDGTRAYVTNFFDDSVSRVVLATGAVTAIPVGLEPLGIAITPDGTAAYVANRFSDSVSRIDLATNAVTAIPVGDAPNAIAITPDGTRAYVAHESESISRIDIATGTATAIPAPGVVGRGIAIAPNGTRAYVISNFGSSSEVVPIDLGIGTLGTPISTSGFLEDIAITPNGARAYVPSSSPDQVLPIELGTNTAATGFSVGTRPEAIAIVPNQPPRAAFEPSPAQVAVGQAVGFSNTSADTDGGSVARYEWDFGDGTVVQNGGATPQHTYAKSGTYQVTLTVTDNEGCSVSIVFTGQTAYCNGSSIARTTRAVKVGLEVCPRVKASASTFVPKRRPGNVLPGVRVKLSSGVPSKLTVTANLIYRQEGKEASAGLGKVSVTVNKWRRIRFAIPPQLRQELPVGTPVKVSLRIETMPRDGNPCEATVVGRTLKVHVVKVFPNRVQAERRR